VAGKVARGDIRLFRFPEPDKQRPVLVLTCDSIIDRLSRITIAPVTSAIRGVASEVVLGCAFLSPAQAGFEPGDARFPPAQSRGLRTLSQLHWRVPFFELWTGTREGSQPGAQRRYSSFRWRTFLAWMTQGGADDQR
jgi:PemK-like, MazF-like toxin of type II toxin-antitoxin system